MSRRALLGGGLALWAGVAQARDIRLEAGPQGYDGAAPGPLLRGKAGEPMRLTLANRLMVPTSLRLPEGAGGFAGLTAPPLAPGDTRAFGFTPSAAGFDLYGPSGPTAQPALFGAIIIDESAPPAVALDAVAVFSAADDGAWRVSGAAAPLRLQAPPGGRVRLRLANAAPDATLELRAQGPLATIVAIDGRPCEPFAPRDGAFALCPGARFELMFDLDGPFDLLAQQTLLRIAPQGAPAALRPPITALPVNPRLPAEIALERALPVRVEIAGSPEAGFVLNDVGGADWPKAPLFKVARGAAVALTLVNQTAEAQTLRLDGAAARILHALDDGWDPYWRDVLHVAPRRTLHAAFVAEIAGKWPLAAVSPLKRASGMAAWYLVT